MAAFREMGCVRAEIRSNVALYGGKMSDSDSVEEYWEGFFLDTAKDVACHFGKPA